MNSEKQHQLLELFFPKLYGRFSDLSNRFGGKMVAEKFKKVFLTNAAGKGFAKSGGFDIKEASTDWEEYRNLTSELIKFAIGVAGTKTVAKEIRATISEVEKETGQSLYEIGFKLNLNRYLEG